MAQKADLLIERSRRAAAFLVTPVCRDAEFSLPVHIVGANLHLDCLTVRPNYSSVKRLVIVVLGFGNVVIEFARQV